MLKKIISSIIRKRDGVLFHGSIDEYSDGVLHGWAAKIISSQKISVVVMAGDVCVGKGIAGNYRGDLLESNIHSGNHSYSISLDVENINDNNELFLLEAESLERIPHDKFSIDFSRDVIKKAYLREKSDKEWLEVQCKQASSARDWLIKVNRELSLEKKLLSDSIEFFEKHLKTLASSSNLPSGNRLGFSNEFDNFYNDYFLYKKRVNDGLSIDLVVQSEISYEEKKNAYERIVKNILARDMAEWSLSFDVYERPVVSIVLVLFNKAELTYQCLLSIKKNVRLPYELIIIDNDSTDDSAELLSKVKGVKYVRNSENIGFLKACNQARKYVEGDYILLLNNDSKVHESAIENSVAVFIEEESVGAVGAKILHLDGLLQEAGSIIWQDGSCLGYGRRSSPDAAEYNFRRDVDYVSGAFFLIETQCWDEMGGLCSDYEPCYYEETDLCVRLHKAGKRVIYEPTAIITHFEFGSSSHSDFAYRQMQKNQKTFLSKHNDFLEGKLEPKPENIVYAANHFGKPIVVYMDDQVPFSKLGGGFPRARDVIGVLKNSYQVVLYPFNESTSERPFDDNLYKNVWILPVDKDESHNLILKMMPRIKKFWLSRPHNMEKYMNYGWEKSLGNNIVYDAEALFSEREILRAGLFNEDQDKLLAQREYELISMADTVVTVCEAEKRKILDRTTARAVFSAGHPLSMQPISEGITTKRSILFVGNLIGDRRESPNVDSVYYFLEVFSEILLASNYTLTLVGDVDEGNRVSWEELGAEVVGSVEELDEYFSKAICTVAPTRYAAGIPHKFHESIARGVPVFASRLILNQCGFDSNDDSGLIDFGMFSRLESFDQKSWADLVKHQRRVCFLDMNREIFVDSVNNAILADKNQIRMV